MTKEFNISETFFSLIVSDMDRAMKFYADSLGASTIWTSARWSSIEIAGVRLGLFADPAFDGGRVGLHFAVTDLQAAGASIERAGGRIEKHPYEVAPGVLVAEVADTEGNVFSLQQTST